VCFGHRSTPLHRRVCSGLGTKGAMTMRPDSEFNSSRRLEVEHVIPVPHWVFHRKPGEHIKPNSYIPTTLSSAFHLQLESSDNNRRQ